MDEIIKALKEIKKDELSERVFYEKILSEIIKIESFDAEKAAILKETLKEIGCKTFQEWRQEKEEKGEYVEMEGSVRSGIEKGDIDIAVSFLSQLLSEKFEDADYALAKMTDGGEKYGWAQNWVKNSKVISAKEAKEAVKEKTISEPEEPEIEAIDESNPEEIDLENLSFMELSKMNKEQVRHVAKTTMENRQLEEEEEKRQEKIKSIKRHNEEIKQLKAQNKELSNKINGISKADKTEQIEEEPENEEIDLENLSYVELARINKEKIHEVEELFAEHGQLEKKEAERQQLIKSIKERTQQIKQLDAKHKELLDRKNSRENPNKAEDKDEKPIEE